MFNIQTSDNFKFNTAPEVHAQRSALHVAIAAAPGHDGGVQQLHRVPELQHREHEGDPGGRCGTRGGAAHESVQGQRGDAGVGVEGAQRVVGDELHVAVALAGSTFGAAAMDRISLRGEDGKEQGSGERYVRVERVIRGCKASRRGSASCGGGAG